MFPITSTQSISHPIPTRTSKTFICVWIRLRYNSKGHFLWKIRTLSEDVCVKRQNLIWNLRQDEEGRRLGEFGAQYAPCGQQC